MFSMKRIAAVLFLGVFFMCSSVMALPLPKEPPIQISGIEVVGGYSILRWDANTESDLGGYILCYSVNGTEFVYGADACEDLGNTTEFNFDDPTIATLWLGGNTIFFALAAYDTAGTDSSAYDIADNVSGFQKELDSGGPVSISFFADAPPAIPSGALRE